LVRGRMLLVRRESLAGARVGWLSVRSERLLVAPL